MEAPTPDVTPLLTPYLLQSLLTLHRCYRTQAQVSKLCETLTFIHTNMTSVGASFKPFFRLDTYDMGVFTSANPLPAPFPFVHDASATSIPDDTKLPASENPYSYSGGQSVMNDVVEAIRQTTTPVTVGTKVTWMPPTANDIQRYMSSTWPQKYRSEVLEAKGWRNSVNQCLTHGKGWNFLTYPPEVGKNKRHFLVERAFNGMCVLGSGVCKGLNDKKPKSTPTPPQPNVPSVGQSSLYTPSPLSHFTPSPVSNVPTTSTSPPDFTAKPLVPLFPVTPGIDREVVYSGYLNTSDLTPIPQYILDYEAANGQRQE
jgi:hypothetical protein